jgi:hypothetical protein
VERFFRHVVSANKVGFLSLESIAAIANGLLTSPLSGAPYLGRRLLERVGPDRHPSLRVALALSLVTETGGPADYEGGHVILGDMLKDDTASDPLRGMAAAALADSARLGRGMDVDLDMAKGMYDTALELGPGRPHTTLACTGRGTGTGVLPATSSQTAQRRHRPTSVVVRTQNALPVSTHCGPVRGKPR